MGFRNSPAPKRKQGGCGNKILSAAVFVAAVSAVTVWLL